MYKAREKLSQLWSKTYSKNIKRLLPMIASDLANKIISVNGVSPYGNDVTQLKRRTPSERAKSITIFVGKFLSYLGLSALFISLGLIVGIIGYHWAAGLSWIDAKRRSLNDSQRHGSY